MRIGSFAYQESVTQVAISKGPYKKCLTCDRKLKINYYVILIKVMLTDHCPISKNKFLCL